MLKASKQKVIPRILSQSRCLLLEKYPAKVVKETSKQSVTEKLFAEQKKQGESEERSNIKIFLYL